MAAFKITKRRACRLAVLNRSTSYYQSCAKDQTPLRVRLRDLAAARVRYGYRRLHVLLRREGWPVNHKRVYRLYTEDGLSVRTRTRKKRVSAARVVRPAAELPNERWSMDFMADGLLDGRRFRVLTLVDHFTRESPAVVVGTSITGRHVVALLEQLARTAGLPQIITCDNGSEFTSRALDDWGHRHGVKLDFIRPGQPVENAYIESFNGRLREECLNQNWFLSLAEAQATIEAWRIDYNQRRPHSALGYQTPEAFAAGWHKYRTAKEAVF